MAKNAKKNVRAILDGAQPFFYMMKPDGYEKLRLLEVRDDSIVIELPKGAPMRRTMLGIITFADGSGVLEVDGRVEAEPGAKAGSIRLALDASRLNKMERRAFPRISFAPPLEASARAQGSATGIPVRIVNLSAGGLRVESAEKLPPDKPIAFRMEIEIDDEVHELSPEGRIVYEIPIEGGHSYGVSFGHGAKSVQLGDDDERTVDLINIVNRLLIRE